MRRKRNIIKKNLSWCSRRRRKTKSANLFMLRAMVVKTNMEIMVATPDPRRTEKETVAEKEVINIASGPIDIVQFVQLIFTNKGKTPIAPFLLTIRPNAPTTPATRTIRRKGVEKAEVVKVVVMVAAKVVAKAVEPKGVERRVSRRKEVEKARAAAAASGD